MKKILLTIGLGTLAFFASAQTVFNVDAPASIGGAYDFEYADTAGTGSGSSWGVFDLTNPINAIVDTLVLVNSIDTIDAGTAINDSSLGCAGYVNEADIAGKIAVVNRGECEFGFKAKRAQDAGAVGVIIVNNIPGNPLGMLAGTFGAQVTIPVVMVSDITGASLISTMMNEDVVVFIGNKSGRFPNDLSIIDNEVILPRHTAIPQSLAQDGLDPQVQVGGWIRNYGFNTQFNVKLTCNISLAGTNIYNEFTTTPQLDSGDSVYVSLPTFSQSTYPAGEYNMVYTVESDSIDDFTGDDMVQANMLINESYISTGRVNASTGLPIAPADNYFWFTKSCMAFSHPFASRVAVRGITFSASSTREDSLFGKFLEIKAYEWDGTDLNTMSDIASGEYDYNANLDQENVTTEFSNVFQLNDFQNYLFCVENNSGDTVYISQSDIGYGESEDKYQTTYNVFEQTNGNLATGFSNITVTPAISIETIPAAAVSVTENKENKVSVYPNPAKDVINIPLGNLEVSSIVIFDVTGKIVSSQDVSNTNNNLVIDVSSIANGSYVIALNKADKTTSKINVVISK